VDRLVAGAELDERHSRKCSSSRWFRKSTDDSCRGIKSRVNPVMMSNRSWVRDKNYLINTAMGNWQLRSRRWGGAGTADQGKLKAQSNPWFPVYTVVLFACASLPEIVHSAANQVAAPMRSGRPYSAWIKPTSAYPIVASRCGEKEMRSGPTMH